MKNLIYLLIAFLWIFTNTSIESQEINPKDLPSFLGKSNAGTEFMFTFVPGYYTGGPQSTENKIRVYVASIYATTVKLEIEGLNYSVEKQTTPYDVTVFDLERDVAMLFNWHSNYPIPSNIYKGRGIRITSGEPIICYTIFNVYASSEASMIYPTNFLGNDYVVASYKGAGYWGYDGCPSLTTVVGVENDTEVVFTLGGSDSSRAIFINDTLKVGNSKTAKLDKGDVWVIVSYGNNTDLSGSKIKSDKPVSVSSGNLMTYIPRKVNSGNTTFEQDLPLNFWGRNYYVSTMNSRTKPPIVKIFAKYPNTNVSINGIQKFNLDGESNLENISFVETRLTDGNPVSSTISADKPINVMLYNPGQSEDYVPTDPFQMHILPTEFFQKDFIFYRPMAKKGMDFDFNYINVVYTSDESGDIPEDMMFGEYIDGKINFQQFKNLKFEKKERFYKIDSSDDVFWTVTYLLPPTGLFRKINLASSGVYSMKSDKPFTVYVYGWSIFDAYGFNASGGLGEHSGQDNNPPVVKISNQDSTLIEGSAYDENNESEIIYKGIKEFVPSSNNSGLAYLILSENSANYKLNYDKLAAIKDNLTDFSLSVINTNFPAKAELIVSDRVGNTTKLNFSYMPDIALPNIIPEIVDLGNIKFNQKISITFKLKNIKSKSTKPISSIILSNQYNGFKIIENIPQNIILKSNDSVEFKITFDAGVLSQKPESVDRKFATEVGYIDSVGNKEFLTTINVNVSDPIMTMNDLDFGRVEVGKSSETKYLTISNLGLTDLNIINYYRTNFYINDFSYIIPKLSNELPLIIKGGDSLRIPFQFIPKDYGERLIEFTINSDGVVLKDRTSIKGIGSSPTSVESYKMNGTTQFFVDKGILNISVDTDNSIESIDIYDINSKIVFNSQYSNNSKILEIDISGFSKGVYIVRLKISGNLITRKIVI